MFEIQESFSAHLRQQGFLLGHVPTSSWRLRGVSFQHYHIPITQTERIGWGSNPVNYEPATHEDCVVRYSDSVAPKSGSRPKKEGECNTDTQQELTPQTAAGCALGSSEGSSYCCLHLGDQTQIWATHQHFPVLAFVNLFKEFFSMACFWIVSRFVLDSIFWELNHHI